MHGSLSDLLAFLGVSAAVICTPGQDTALTLRHALSTGRRGGLQTALGVSAGQLVWAVAASTGLAALLAASEPAFQALKLAGAVYLVLLGLQALRDAVRGLATHSTAGSRGGGGRRRSPFRQGFVSNLGNPKMAVFFAGLLPQFATGFLPMLVLGAAFAALTLAWLALYSYAVGRARDALQRPRIRRALDAVTGTALVALGVRLATEDSV
jgi:threonine/homoserine/homoserine lactone efflux protein